MKIKLIILALCLSSCAQTKTTTLTLTPIKSLPKTAQKKVVRRFVAQVTDGSGRTMPGGQPKRTPKIVEVYDIGSTVNAEGDLVGPHQLYRVVETETWASPAKKRTAVPPEDKPIPYKPKERQSSQITQTSNPEPNPKASEIDQRNSAAEPVPAPDDSIKKAVEDGFSLGTPAPDVEGLNKAVDKP